jgi:tyrosyl-tRNA synthetase
VPGAENSYVSYRQEVGPDAPASIRREMAPQLDAQSQLEQLTRNAAEIIPVEELRRKLEESAKEGRPLRVKLGIDPSRPDLHLGHTVVLRKLQEFQDLGHVAVLIIGDFTGLVGDPSGQSETRPMLAPEELEANAQSYLDQAGLVLDVERAEIRRNSEWLAPMSMADVLRLSSHYTVARMLERDDFQVRYREGRPISVVEFLYPLMQSMDSVAIRADVEMGGTDQTFNLLVGRDIQRAYGQDPQVVFTMPLLVGTDGTRKMSKSFDNYVALTDPPEEMFGKLMRVPDEQIVEFLRLCTGVDPGEVAAVGEGLQQGSLHPNEAKRNMARAIVALYYGSVAAHEAERRFDQVHRKHELPPDIVGVPLPLALLREFGASLEKPGAALLPAWAVAQALGLAATRSEARRLIRQGGMKVDGQPVAEDAVLSLDLLRDSVWQVGRRRFVRVAGFGG